MPTRKEGRYYRNSVRETREINQVELKLLKFSSKSEIAMDGATYKSYKLIR